MGQEIVEAEARLRAAEGRAQNALRAVDAANDELRRARRELIAADKAFTRLHLLADLAQQPSGGRRGDGQAFSHDN